MVHLVFMKPVPEVFVQMQFKACRQKCLNFHPNVQQQLLLCFVFPHMGIRSRPANRLPVRSSADLLVISRGDLLRLTRKALFFICFAGNEKVICLSEVALA